MAPFVYEQMKVIQALGVDCQVMLINKGAKGYLSAIKHIRNAIKEFSPDIVHAHYGLCGIIANTQRKVPVITTFHGSDLNYPILRVLSSLAVIFSKANIVVSEQLKKRVYIQKNLHVIPCGINANLLVPMDKDKARSQLGWVLDKKYILFSKEFFNKAKNYPLAKAGVTLYNSSYDSKAKLLEFIGYSREQVLLLFNAVDCVLMTSDYEGSPQFIKEAMACNCPIVSVDVGDVPQVISGTDGCYIAERDPSDIAEKLNLAINHGKTNGRDKVLKEFEAGVIAQKIKRLYEEVVND